MGTTTTHLRATLASTWRTRDHRRSSTLEEGQMRDFRVIGVDPAPSKPATVCDGSQIQPYWPSELAEHLETSCREGNTLICWDAPLTGPPALTPAPPPRNAKTATASARSRWYSQRIIEGFLRRLSPPKGISVQPYSGCPHWAVSRAVLGFPRVGRYDVIEDGDPPWRLAHGQAEAPIEGAWLAEVHPAVAIWLWLRTDAAEIESWEYKSKPKDDNSKPKDDRSKLQDHKEPPIEVLKRCLISKLDDLGVQKSLLTTMDDSENDDQLDAAVAYALGWLWLNGEHAVMLLGDAQTGAMLAPWCDATREEFDRYKAQQLGSVRYGPLPTE
jgi:hypothetical protein